MFRKATIAIAAASVITAASLTPASAHGWGHHGFGFGAAAFGIGVLGAIAATTATTDCWQYRLVETPRGYYKRVLVNVCY
jgi:hypothetical protein